MTKKHKNVRKIPYQLVLENSLKFLQNRFPGFSDSYWDQVTKDAAKKQDSEATYDCWCDISEDHTTIDFQPSKNHD